MLKYIIEFLLLFHEFDSILEKLVAYALPRYLYISSSLEECYLLGCSATRHNIPEDGILHSHHHGNLKS
jgi:hypothetical protein